MSRPEFTLFHARELLSRIFADTDGAHATEMLELVYGIADPGSVVAVEVQKELYVMTPDFHAHFKDYLSKLKAA